MRREVERGSIRKMTFQELFVGIGRSRQGIVIVVVVVVVGVVLFAIAVGRVNFEGQGREIEAQSFERRRQIPHLLIRHSAALSPL